MSMEYRAGESGERKSPDKEELKRLYVDERRSPDQICQIYGVSRSAVYNWLKGYGIQRRSLSEAAKLRMSKPGSRISPVIEVSFIEKTAMLLDLPEDELYRELKEEGESIPRYHKRPGQKFLDYMYNKRRRSTTQIGGLFDVTPSTVGRWLKYYHIRPRNPSEAQLLAGQKPSKSVLEDLFLNKERSPREIAELRHVSRSAVNRWLKEEGIRPRTRKEAARLKAVRKR